MLSIRQATPADVPLILAFIHELAAYEREPQAVVATEADIARDGFGPAPRFRCFIAELCEANNAAPQPAGFALFFNSYSTWEGHHGIYLEDLYVQPQHRGKGIGRALLSRVAAIAVEEGCPRLEWSVLDWNQPSIDFYHRIGAVKKSEWFIMRLSDDALNTLAATSKR
jgi:GNAT superfamily N-acetyltransferase